MAKDEIGKVVIIGGSAGSLGVIMQVLPELPVFSNTVYVIVMHRKNDADSILPVLLSTKTGMPVKEVEDKEQIIAGSLYVAPADYHLLFEGQDFFSLDSSEKVHYSRPSIDVSFESAALSFGSKVIGVLLSGANADGAEGLRRIQQAGGITVAQDPESAEVSYMPEQAIALNSVDHIVSQENLSQALKDLLS